ncbi:lymphocyte antigen 6 complex locus protein G5c [Molossus nigricans]|uniref:Lymphocyte antigen 6 complex locus protein G5c n=1 Tax=Molossus molossus TaxID=27622 RepID=A0A7J8GR79_MOLMO|nr:lymphocyte antigen 6 complex locus protein G5c [Molossus molossus]KAF6462408.1 lymphocyte antigen 6 family member G5C [Molossus molossus]
MHFMAGPACSRSLGPLGLHSNPQALYMVLLIALVMMSLVFGKFDRVNQEPPYPDQLPKYLRCYRCLLETKELGCLLGSDICLASPGSSCMTLFIKNSSGSDIMVSDCRRKDQMSDCSRTRASPVFGFWMFSRCCFQNFCNNPQNREFYIP